MLFHLSNRTRSEKSQRLYAAFEIADTVIAFLAAISFLVGSILFLWQDYETPAIWLFIVGSAFFCLKPTVRLVREIRLASMGDEEDLAKRYES
ncbi:YrhK family protein [Roseovarius sp. SCSIO 43702]|uniref:YrhK family protein n=1 Tax=Roseovarius sp. SCSIO 43702 TaxID=2823043 RepID=UPI001C73D932|nr:YrhK family protein [Roseovarius sp. SCSIO 43702]QYX57381.1 YrhK family protein [Roseovarius sp. SCSIO 43702]